MEHGRLVGRGVELAAITAIVERAAAGRGGLVLLEGEAGIGKTMVAAEVHHHAADLGVRVLRGAARELGQQISFTTIASFLPTDSLLSDPTLTRLQSLLHGKDWGASVVANYEFAVVDTLLTLVEHWCAQGPLALIVDDMQWSDPASSAALLRLGETAADLPLILVLISRPSPARTTAVLWTQLANRDAMVLRLGPLPETDANLLAERVVGSPIGPRLAARVADAGGNPLYVCELVTGLLREGHITTANGVADHTAAAMWLPTSLTSAIARRLDLLPRRTRQILAAAAVLPCVDSMELATVLGTSMVEVGEAVTAALDVGLLRGGDDELTFAHELFREVFANQLPGPSQLSLRRHAAHVLMSADAPADRIACYLGADNGPLDTRSATWLTGAGKQLVVRSPDSAAVLLERALAAPGLEESDTGRLRLLHIRALLRAGRAKAAESTIRAIVDAGGSPDGGDPDEVVLRWLLVRACFAQGNLDDAITAAHDALARPGLPSRAVGRYHGLVAVAHLFSDQIDAAEQAAEQAISVGASGNDPMAISMGWSALGGLRYGQGLLDESLDFIDRAIEIYPDGALSDARSDRFDPYVARCRTLIELDRLADVEDTLRSAVLPTDDERFLTPSQVMVRARVAFLAGQWDDALAEIHAYQDLPGGFGYGPALQTLQALIVLRRGGVVDLDDITASNRSPGTRAFGHQLFWVRALVCEFQGRLDEALQILTETHTRRTTTIAGPILYYMYPDLARLAATTGDVDVLEAVAADAEALVVQQPTHSRRATAALCRGLADNRPDLLDQAATSFRLAGRPWYEAAARENLAGELARDGRTTEARTAWDQAVELYRGMGAEWDIERIEARMRGLGLSRNRRRARGQAAVGRDALTPTERKVAELMAQGLTNSDIADRLFLSRRTAETHVYSILRKFGVQSRVQVAVNLIRTGS